MSGGPDDLSVGVLLHVPRSATAEEWRRWALDSQFPGGVIAALLNGEERRLYPEIAALSGVPQDPEWHPEGPVEVHTAHVLNAAAEIAAREALPEQERLVLLFAALTHDFGKPGTTRRRHVRGGTRWTSWGHEAESVPLARGFMERIGMDETVVRSVLPLVAYHMAYRWFEDRKAGARTVRRLASRLAPATVHSLAQLIEADHSGRPPLPPGLPPSAERMRELARKHPRLPPLRNGG